MSVFTVPNIFVANTLIKSASVNANFAAIASTLNTNLLPAVGNTNALVTTDSGGNLASVLPIGTAGQALLVGPTGTLEFGTLSSGTELGTLDNLGLAVSAAGGALTIALKQSDGVSDPATASGTVVIGVRNPAVGVGGYNSRSVQEPLSMTLSLGTTLGMLAGQNNPLYIYAVDTDGAGTMALACSAIRWDDSTVYNIVNESSPVTISIASPAIMSGTDFNYLTGNTVQFTTTGSLPTGLTTGQNFFIFTPSSTSTELGSDPSSAPINTSGSQSGVHTVHVADPSVVSNATYSAVAIRLIGAAVFNLTTSGSWVAPASVSLFPSIPESIVSTSYYAQNQVINNGNLGFTDMLYDTTGAGANGVWLAPRTALYKFDYGAQVILPSNGDFSYITVEVNGTLYLGNVTAAGLTGISQNTNGVTNGRSITIPLNRFDYVAFNSQTSTNITAAAYYYSVTEVSGV